MPSLRAGAYYVENGEMTAGELRFRMYAFPRAAIKVDAMYHA
jgi:hypothetical protein